MTKFSFEVPLAHLKDFEPYQDFTFALSFLLDRAEYSEYVYRHCEEGKVVYIDNSWNELTTPANPEEMADIYYRYFPTAVASPDADYWTPKETMEAFHRLAYRVNPRHIMGVFKSPEEHYHLSGDGCRLLATSYWWRERTEIATYRLFEPKNSHYLGLGNLEEVMRRQPASLDTSKPIKMAIKGIAWEQWDGIYRRDYTPEQDTGPLRLQRAMDFLYTKLTDAQLELAVHNIEALRAAVNYDGVEVSTT